MMWHEYCMLRSSCRFCQRYNDEIELEDAVHTAILTVNIASTWLRQLYCVHSEVADILTPSIHL
jgi:hypothetical protein